MANRPFFRRQTIAISYIRAQFPSLTAALSVAHIVGYVGRLWLREPRGGAILDFRRHGADLVHQGVLLPAGAPPLLIDPAALALAIDAAEVRRVRRFEGRQRHPQAGLLLVVALPPDAELTLDEAVELTTKLVDRVRGSRALPAYVAIHDPAVTIHRAFSRNRHAHVFVGLRENGGVGFDSPKVRDLVARVRKSADSAFTHCVPEGLSWPDLAHDRQSEFFAELGIDCVVDPPACAPEKHLSDIVLEQAPEEIAKRRDNLARENRAVIDGDPPKFVARVLRGRGSLRIGELRRLIARFVVGDDAQQDALDRVLIHADIVALAPQGADRATHLTTAAADHLLRQVGDIVAQAQRSVPDADSWEKSFLSAVRGVGRDAVQETLRAKIRAGLTRGAAEAVDDVVLLAPGLSTIESLWADDPLPAPIRRKTISDALVDAGWDRRTVIAAPHSEEIGDLALAELIVRAHQHQARLLLGFDESYSPGAATRLAAVIADRLTAISCGAPAAEGHRTAAERCLRAGLIRQGAERLAAAGALRFGKAGDQVDPKFLTHGAILVLDDPKRLFQNVPLYEERGDTPEGSWPIPCDGKYFGLSPGGTVVFTATDYRVRPPVIRAGDLAAVDEITPAGVARVSLASGGRAHVDLKEWKKLRPARSLLIREARRSTDLPLWIEFDEALGRLGGAVACRPRARCGGPCRPGPGEKH